VTLENRNWFFFKNWVTEGSGAVEQLSGEHGVFLWGMIDFTFTFGAATFVAVALGLLQFGSSSQSKDASSTISETLPFRSFRNNYVLVYLIMTGADWVQGAYVYALYEHYGFERGDIGLLFVCGFGSSLIFGTFFGSIADK